MEFVPKFLEYSKSKKIALHLDFIGLFRLGSTNEERLKNFSNILCLLGSNSQSIAIPSFTYSFTENIPFESSKTPSKTGFVSEYLRNTALPKRTLDGIFSYITYGDSFTERHFEIGDFESFGDDGIAGEVFADDGWIASVGGVFRHATEVHFLEKKLNVSYRYDKDFHGEIIDIEGKGHKSTVRYFCRKDLNIRPDFRKFENDLRDKGLLQTWSFESHELEIEAVKIKDAFELLKTKIAKDEYYLCVEVDKWTP